MKPRLEPLPLTREDMDIWLSIGHLVQPSRKHFGDVLDAISEPSDRRDADLMLALSQFYRPGIVAWLHRPPAAHTLLYLNEPDWNYARLNP